MRVKRGFKGRRYHKKILKRAKGFRGSGHRLFTVALEKSDRALSFQYEHRRQFKNDIRKLWNHRIGVATKGVGVSYSRFMGFLKKSNIQLNRPVLAQMAFEQPEAFKKLATQVVKMNQ